MLVGPLELLRRHPETVTFFNDSGEQPNLGGARKRRKDRFPVALGSAVASDDLTQYGHGHTPTLPVKGTVSLSA